VPDPISSNSRTEPNACYQPESAASASVCAPRPEAPPNPSGGDAPESSAAVQQLVSRSSLSAMPGGVYAGSTGVLLCRRVADIPLNEYLKLQHHFIVTEAKAAGAGHCGGGIPGHGQIDLPLSPMCINDHASEVGRPDVVCEPVVADPTCVNRELEFERPIGPWAPPFNDCQTFAARVIADCSTAPDLSSPSASGAEGSRGY
jgi:hypothetical protein